MISLGNSGRMAQPMAPVVACKVVGVGGAGLKILEGLALADPGPLELVAMHTDAQALMRSSAPRKVQLGREEAKGLGAGGNPALGEAAAREQADAICAECEGSQVVVVCAGLGGGTGSGAAPVVAHEARKAGALVIGVATLPFAGEGGRRHEQAAASLARLGRTCAAVLCFENDRMGEVAGPGAPLAEAFAAASATLAAAVGAVLRIVGLPSVLQVGLDEFVQIFRGADARCHFGQGAASGPDRAQLAVEAALQGPMLEAGSMLSRAGNVLVHIAGDPSLRLEEMQSVLAEISRHLEPSSQVFLGIATDPRAEDALAVTVMAATHSGGTHSEDEEFEPQEPEAAPPPAAESGEKPPKPHGGKRSAKRGAPDQQQEELPLDQAIRGRFKNLDPTMVDGQDLDIPAYIRMRLRLK